MSRTSSKGARTRPSCGTASNDPSRGRGAWPTLPSAACLCLMLLFLASIALSACATQPTTAGAPARPGAPPPAPGESAPAARPSPPTSTSPALPPEKTAPRPSPSPRMVASLRLTEEARILLETGKPDEAIRTLERAVNLSPSNGQNFYYLSEAWMMKKDYRQAEEFNRLAALYLKDDSLWETRITQQADRIRRGGAR